MAIIISFGIAGFIAAIFAVKNSLKWVQPAVPLIVAIFMPISWNALGNWIDIISNTTGLFMISLGFVGLILAVYTTKVERQIWLSSCLWIGQIMVPSGAFAIYESTSELMMVLLILVSTTSWIIGVITLRRAWRIIGALDLVLAWLIASVLIISGTPGIMLLAMLMATAVLLGLVTWLGQKYEEEISVT